jgi:hypothetical protein
MNPLIQLFDRVSPVKNKVPQMFKSIVRALTVVGVSSFFASASYAQTTGSQTFTIAVPQSISITAPAAATLIHDQSDNPQACPVQAWTVKGNSNSGVNVNFTAATPFTHTANPTFRRNARLNLALGSVQGPATWTVGVNQAQTNYTTNAGATVTATSTGVGRANLNLTVSFITEEFGVFAQGDYTTTVIGTVAAN